LNSIFIFTPIKFSELRKELTGETSEDKEVVTKILDDGWITNRNPLVGDIVFLKEDYTIQRNKHNVTASTENAFKKKFFSDWENFYFIQRINQSEEGEPHYELWNKYNGNTADNAVAFDFNIVSNTALENYLTVDAGRNYITMGNKADEDTLTLPDGSIVESGDTVMVKGYAFPVKLFKVSHRYGTVVIKLGLGGEDMTDFETLKQDQVIRKVNESTTGTGWVMESLIRVINEKANNLSYDEFVLWYAQNVIIQNGEAIHKDVVALFGLPVGSNIADIYKAARVGETNIATLPDNDNVNDSLLYKAQKAALEMSFYDFSKWMKDLNIDLATSTLLYNKLSLQINAPMKDLYTALREWTGDYTLIENIPATEEEPSTTGKIKMRDIQLSVDDWKTKKEYEDWERANSYVASLINQQKNSDVSYIINFADDEVLEGDIDLEPKSFWEDTGDLSQPLSWHLNIFHNNVANSTAGYIPSDHKEFSRHIINNYDLGYTGMVKSG
jgi:hypothetical protein